MFTLCCIQAKAFNIAIPILDQDAFQIETDSTALDAKDTRLYFYYGGVAYMAMKKFQQSVDFFKAVRSFSNDLEYNTYRSNLLY